MTHFVQIHNICKKYNLPLIKDLDVWDYPYDIVYILNFRFYLDSIEEAISYFDLPEPSELTKTNPRYFKEWVKYAQKYQYAKPEEKEGYLNILREESWLEEFLERGWFNMTLYEFIKFEI